METLKAYIWDLDGTLFDSYGAIVSAWSMWPGHAEPRILLKRS